MIRKIVADVVERSFTGTPEDLRLASLVLTEGSRQEIDWRIGFDLGVDLRGQDWSSFITVGDLVARVEIELERQGDRS